MTSYIKLKTACVFGATGLIGGYVVKELLKNKDYSQIKIFTRRSLHIADSRISEILTDFSDTELLTQTITGDEIYCCLGTTIAKAGSKQAFRKVDFELPLLIAKIAVKNKIPKMLVVSSLGADAQSSNFYLKTKGEMENALSSLQIPFLKFFRPSMLLGPRKESRPAETIGKFLMQTFNWLFIGKLEKYKAIHANVVAQSMIKVAQNEPKENIFESDVIAKM